MNMLKLSKILIVSFIILTATSTISIYYTHQLPTSENRTTTLCTYEHTGNYGYVAELRSNTIYNETTLHPGEGTLYTAIIDHINLTFTYTFNCNPQPSNNTINSEITTQLESPEKWTRTLSNSEAQEILKLSHSSLNFSLQVNHTKIKKLVDSIDDEVGTHSWTYNVNINPIIHIVVNVTTETIEETFTPELTVAFNTGTEKGTYITIGNLNQTKSGKLTEIGQISLPWVQNQRALAYLATATTATVLAISAFVYHEYKPVAPPKKISEKLIKKLMAPYKELIVETTQKPPETKTTIETETLEDLAKTAEILARPILHATDGKEHTFYIIDNNTKHQHKTKT